MGLGFPLGLTKELALQAWARTIEPQLPSPEAGEPFLLPWFPSSPNDLGAECGRSRAPGKRRGTLGVGGEGPAASTWLPQPHICTQLGTSGLLSGICLSLCLQGTRHICGKCGAAASHLPVTGKNTDGARTALGSQKGLGSWWDMHLRTHPHMHPPHPQPHTWLESEVPHFPRTTGASVLLSPPPVC